MKFIPLFYSRLYPSGLMLSILALISVLGNGCKPASNDSSPTPLGSTPSVTILSVGNFVVPEPGRSNQLDYLLAAHGASYSESSSLATHTTHRATLTWAASDSAERKVTAVFTTPDRTTVINKSGLYSRTQSTWLLAVGCTYGRFFQTINVIKQPYYAEPRDSAQVGFAFLNADPTKRAVRVYFNNIDLGVVAYGSLSPTPMQYTPQPNDKLVTLDANNLSDTLCVTGLNRMFTRRMNILAQYPVFLSTTNPDSVAHRVQGYGQW